MKLFKLSLILVIIIFISSCGTIKDGFTNQKKNSSDEFLVEKKSPLVMPPDYNELPIPNETEKDDLSDESESGIRSLILKKKDTENKENSENNNLTFENSILKKIKNK